MISILMANYNNRDYLAEAIQSIIAQTLEDWELVIVDDASTDGSELIAADFTSDPRVTLVRRDRNGGFGETLRTAIHHATQPIIGILDSDDALEKDALRIMVEEHGKSNCGLLYSQHLVCDERLRKVRIGCSAALEKSIPYLEYVKKDTTRNPVCAFRTFKRAAYDRTVGFTTRRRTVDKDFVLKLEEAGCLKFIDEPLYRYRNNPRGISRAPNPTRVELRAAIAEAAVRRGLPPQVFPPHWDVPPTVYLTSQAPRRMPPAGVAPTSPV